MWLGDEQFSHHCENLELTPSVDIPLHDPDALDLNPGLEWLFDKRRILNIQNLKWFPHGKLTPDFLPCFSKPLQNLWGMGINTSHCIDREDYLKNYYPAHICMEVLTGEHSTFDVAVDQSKILDWRCTVGYSMGDGRFSHWQSIPIHESPNEVATFDRRRFILEFIDNHMQEYKGMLNFEFIGDKCIEVHPRCNTEMMCAWGPQYIKQVKYFYEQGTWHAIKDFKEGCTVPVWGKLNKKYKMKLADRVKFSVADGVNFVYYDIDNIEDSNPPGGQRLAFVAGHDYEKCREHAQKLSDYFNG